ncbi:MAG TPA: DUF2203 domain-containing protein [Candidatus Xenobia bacterium]|jgi:hypothetical protein
MHLYNRESANKLLPSLRQLLEEIVEKRRELTAIQRQLHSRHMHPVDQLLADEDGRLSRRFEQLDEELFALIQQVQKTGAVVKDLEMGLIDFPAVVDRQPVYLCWKLGEDDIRFYHGVEEGFYGRKPL